jgi:hypothetical protein
LLGILFLPMIEQKTGWVRVGPLRGQGDPASYPSFTLRDWFSDKFQPQFNQATEDHVGFRSWLIRLKNELEFAVYNKANASGVISGKDRYLYESDYIRSYTGRDYLGTYFWNQKFNRLKKVSDTLSQLGVRLAIVLEPGKATYYPEFIPNRYFRFSSDHSNYLAILARAKDAGIPLLDLNRYFREKKPSAPWPLFPKGGIHWSTGGMVVAVDTLLDYIDKTLEIPVPDLVIDGVDRSDSLRNTDGDLAEIMNLIWEPLHPVMGYPRYHFVKRDTARKPRVLAISDSFFFNILNAGIPSQAFANEAFWYYNKSIYPDTWTTPTDTSSVDIPKTVEGMDLVLIMVTERFYHRFDWDFTDVLYQHYFPESPKEYRYDYMRGIVRNYVWFDDIQEQADFSGQPMEKKLYDNADYLFWLDDQAGKIPHDLGYYRMNILKDPEWMKKIRDKAEANQITVDEQVTRDAQWMLDREKR